MNILFVNRKFPGQFKHLVTALASNPNNKVMFITNDEITQIKGITKFVYKINEEVPKDCHSYLKKHEELLIHGKSAATLTLDMKKQNIKIDVIYSDTSGPGLFMKYIYPDIPMISYCDWYNRSEGADIGFDGNIPNEDDRARIRVSNSLKLIDLYSCEAFIASTDWQKSRFPKEYQDQIKVFNDGIDTEFFQPNNKSKFIIKDKNIELTSSDEVITYGTRGMEPYRGFPEFMMSVEQIQKKRPNAHIIITGEDKTYYSEQLDGNTYKRFVLEHLDLNLDKLHFVGTLSQNEYVKLLQISSVHVYLTYPYMISNSFLEAMSTGCCVVASNTQPVLEFMRDDYNGLLFDFYNTDQLIDKVEYALDNSEKLKVIRENARKTIVENYGIEKIIPQQIKYINNIINDWNKKQ